jgi:L-alanine-DL-glutamate epimerase-like enolase superfamily enzyme
LQIETIELYQVDLPYSGGVYRLSGGREYSGFDASIVRLVADNGTDGWGESTPFGSTFIAAHALGVRAGISEIVPSLLGLDPRPVDRLNETMDKALVGHNHAKCAIDVACWDLFGKSVGMPVCELLGGSTKQRMPLISSIYTGPPEEMRARVADHRARGFRGHSVKIGATDAEGGPALDAERIAATLADRQPNEFFLVDANGSMTPETALRMLRLIPNNLDFVLEAPCATWRETLSLRKRCSVPIMMDELIQHDEDVVQLIALDAADGIGLKISKSGGLTRGRRQRDMALSAGLTMSVQDTAGSDIAFAAIVHLAQTVPEHALRCILDVRDLVTVSTARLNAPFEDGGVMAPNAPGLGISVDRDMLGPPVATWSL